MSNGAQQASGSTTYRMLRELGSRSQHSYAAIREPHDLVVAQRFVRLRPGAESTSVVVLAGETSGEKATPLDAESMALLLRDARCLAKNWQLNIGRVRHVDLYPAPRSELIVATELIDGTTLADLCAAAEPERTSLRDPVLALPLVVRILLDVLAGLHALHTLRDGMNAPLGAIHGELCPANVVVGRDGVARIVNVLRKRPVRIAAGSEAVGYGAPEALDRSQAHGGADDPRADVYAVGVMLWEALAGHRLYDETDPALVLSRQREGDLVAPTIHPSSPFARLADVAMRALAFDPSLRFKSAAEMTAELRRIVGTRLAPGTAVAARVADLAGDRIRSRRATLDPAMSGTRRTEEALAPESTRASMQAPPASESSLPLVKAPPVRKSAVLRASPRVGAPTMRAEISVALIAASRESTPDLRAGLRDEVAEEFDDEEELPGPRGSSPQLDLETALQLAAAHAQSLLAASETTDVMSGALPRVSPVTPNLSLPTPPLVDAVALPPAPMFSPAPVFSSAPMFSSAPVLSPAPVFPSAPAFPVVPGLLSPLPPTSTPGDFVIPIDVTETLNREAPARRSRAFAMIAACAAVLLVAMGAFVAFRAGTALRQSAPAAAAPAPPAPALEDAPVIDPTAIATTPTARPKTAASAVASAASSAPTPGANVPPAAVRPSGVTVVAPPPAAPASSAPAKPKKSIYDPDDGP